MSQGQAMEPDDFAPPQPARPMRLLLVDDEPQIVAALARALRRSFGSRLAIESFSAGQTALDRLRERSFDVVISDLRMPGIDGLTLLAETARLQPRCVRLVLSATADFATAQQAINSFGLFRFLTKPWDTAELRAHVQAALEHAEAQRLAHERALAWAAQTGALSRQDLERERLEAMEPGLTRVEWDADGAVIMPPLDAPLGGLH